MNTKSSARSVEREDIIEGHAQYSSVVQHLHIVDVFIVPHCFPSFLNYGGLLIVTLFGNFGSSHIGHCSLFQLCVVVCVMLLLFWSLFQFWCCCLHDALAVLVIVWVTLLLFWPLFSILVLLFV